MGYGDWQRLLCPPSPSLLSLAISARLLLRQQLDAASQRHVIWARLRGLSARQVERQHVLRNATLPVVTAMGMHIGELIGGTMVIENIFAWRGRPLRGFRHFQSRLPGVQCFYPDDGDGVRAG